MSRITWESPSNIAIIKYWGKHGRQLPNNASISFTLQNAKTTTSLVYEPKQNSPEISLTFRFEGKENPVFASKIAKHLSNISRDYFPFLQDYHLDIESSNTFPHSSGIASSASAMSALALCIVDMQKQLGIRSSTDPFNLASRISRLGSGSACRSVYGKASLWGYHAEIDGSSDAYAIPMGDILHLSFKSFHDDIMIISADEKSVSSTAGHGLMIGNPYAEARYEQANARLLKLLDVLKAGDIDAFGKIAEDEAMTLHALMMCSDPSYVLMKANTLLTIEKIRDFRKETKLPLYFTLDAGPNVHLLYPDSEKSKIQSFINQELKPLCHLDRIIQDCVGSGPQKLV
jgi:diphosphomevalonate decarboxylase